MKRFIRILIILTLVLSLVSCGDAEDGGQNPDRPPAFSVLQKQIELAKRAESGESTAFSKEDFVKALGEELTYVTVTALPDEKAGTLIFNGSAVISGQTLPAEQLEFLRFVPSQDCKSASFDFTCDAKGFYGNDILCSIVFDSGVNVAPIATDSTLETVSGITCFGSLAINEPNGDDYVINVVTYPTDGYVTISADGEICYTPEEGFSGTDSMVFAITDRFGARSENALVTISVEENTNQVVFADMQDNPSHLSAYKMCRDNVMVYKYENGEFIFEPDCEVSKMDLLVMLMCASSADGDVTAVADSQVTDDTGLSTGLKGYLAAASDKGMLYLEDGRFNPKASATVSDAAYMIASVLSLPDRNAGKDAILSAVSAVVKAGIIKTENGVLDPNAVLTKAETADILCRVTEYMKSNNICPED